MTKPKNKTEILKMIYALQIPDKALMRSIGYSYDWTGRILTELLNKKYIKSTDIDNMPRAITLTKLGYGILQEKYSTDNEVSLKIKERIKGNENKERQYRIATTVQLFNSYIPEYIDYFLQFEKEVDAYVGSLGDVIKRNDKIERYRLEFERRRLLNKNGRFFITIREMRELDNESLRNIQSPRALGLLHFESGNYVVYNSLKTRMRIYGDFDMLYRNLLEETLDNSINGSITFATSNKVFIDSINGKTNEKQYFTLSNHLHKKSYYVPLDSNGAQQLFVYTIPNFKKRMAEGLFEKDSIDRAQNTIYDAIDENNNISYLAFECDYNEIETLKMNIESIHAKSELQIYCFPHQVKLFESIFGERATILEVPVESVEKYFENK